jgi:hypothetical protein
MKKLILIAIFFSSTIMANEIDFDGHFDELNQLSINISKTIKTYNTFGKRRQGYAVLTKQKEALRKLHIVLESLVFDLKLENKLLKIENHDQDFEIERLRRACSL